MKAEQQLNREKQEELIGKEAYSNSDATTNDSTIQTSQKIDIPA